MEPKPKLLIILSIAIILVGVLSLFVLAAHAYPNIKGAYAPWYSPIMAILYIVGGIGALRLKNWGRWLILIFCSFYMIKTPLNIILWFNRFGNLAAEAKTTVLISGVVTLAIYSSIAYYLGVKIGRLFKKQ